MKKYLFLCLLPLAACQKENDETPQDKPLMPLAVGNSWTWDNKVYNSDGSYCCKEEDITLEVLGKGTRTGYFSLDEENTEQVFSSADKIIYYYPDEPEETEIEFRKSNKLDTFDVQLYEDGYKLVSIAFPENYVIENYNCIKNEYIMYDDIGNIFSKDVHYVAPGIGYVRLEYFYADENGDLKLDMREDLLSYNLK